MTRQDINYELLFELEGLILDNPDLRFSQILDVFGFVKAERPARPEAGISWQNEFYLEPDLVLKRVQQRIKDIEASDK